MHDNLLSFEKLALPCITIGRWLIIYDSWTKWTSKKKDGLVISLTLRATQLWKVLTQSQKGNNTNSRTKMQSYPLTIHVCIGESRKHAMEEVVLGLKTVETVFRELARHHRLTLVWIPGCELAKKGARTRTFLRLWSEPLHYAIISNGEEKRCTNGVAFHKCCGHVRGKGLNRYINWTKFYTHDAQKILLGQHWRNHDIISKEGSQWVKWCLRNMTNDDRMEVWWISVERGYLSIPHLYPLIIKSSSR